MEKKDATKGQGEPGDGVEGDMSKNLEEVRERAMLRPERTF